jgi:hypothetical protein
MTFSETLHWSTSRSKVRDDFAAREERRTERLFNAHDCRCGDDCYLARLDHIVVRKIALALDEDRCIVRDSMPPRD